MGLKLGLIIVASQKEPRLAITTVKELGNFIFFINLLSAGFCYPLILKHQYRVGFKIYPERIT